MAALNAAPPTSSSPLLLVRNLNVHFRTRAGTLQVVSDVSFDLRAGERVGIVGESGSGKTVTGLALLGLLPRASARITGTASFEGRDLIGMSERAIRSIRGRHIGMIFQEPMSALDPIFTIGAQIVETLLAHFPIGLSEARERALSALDAVGMPAPALRYHEYPHQLSGGMRQRAMIAMAVACEPRILIADEPTTALDVTIQAQIIDLLLRLSERSGVALLFITHDIGVLAQTCTRLLTMYAGQIVEDAPVDDVLVTPLHPYTSGLQRSLPRLAAPKTTLPSIGGRPPAFSDMPQGCRFAPRCCFREPRCDLPPPFLAVGSGHARCARASELSLLGCVA